MTARITSGATGAAVTSVRPRVSVSVVAPTTLVQSVVPVVDVDYILLAVSSALDTSGRYRYIAESFVVVDGMQFLLTKNASDAFLVTDTPPILSVAKGLADSVSFPDLFNAVLVFLRDFSDTQVIVDSPAWVLSKPFSDTIGISDASSFLLSRSFSDGFAMNDSFDLGDGAQYTFTKSINNVVFLSDEISQIITKPVTDSVTLSDSGLGSMQNYCDITYFAEDYVGISFTF